MKKQLAALMIALGFLASGVKIRVQDKMSHDKVVDKSKKKKKKTDKMDKKNDKMHKMEDKKNNKMDDKKNPS